MNKVLYNIDQRNDTTDAQKTTARNNIGAASAVSLSEETARAIAAEVASATYDSENHLILFKNSANTQLFSLDATAFVMGGMIDSVVVEDGKLKITFITESGTETVSVDIGDIFDANNYYTKSETDELLSGKVDKVSGKGLSTNDFTTAYKNNVDSNTSARHTHSNKSVLDGISSSEVANWNAHSVVGVEADSTTAFDANTPVVVGYNSTSKKLKTRLVSALMSFLGISVSNNAKSFSGTADTADKVNYDTINSGNAYVPVFDHNGMRLKVVAGSHGLIMQKASDSDYPLLSCKSALAADADHAANADKVSNHTVGTDVPADAKFIEYVNSSNTFADVKAIVDAGHLPVYVVDTIPTGPSGYYKYRFVLSSYHYSASQGKSASFSRTTGNTVTTYTIDGSTNQWTTTTTTLQEELSEGNGITISSNVVSAKVKSGGGLVLDSNGLAVDSSFSGMFIGTYSQSVETPYNDYKTAYDAGKAVYLRMTALGGSAMFQLYDIDSSKAVFTRIVGIASTYCTDSKVSTIIVSSSNVYSTYNTSLASKADLTNGLSGKNPTLSTSGSISTYSNNAKLRLRKFNVADTGSFVNSGVSGTQYCGIARRIYTNYDSSHPYAFPCHQDTSSYNTFSPIFRKIMYDGILGFTNTTNVSYYTTVEPGNYQSSTRITTWCDEAGCRITVEPGNTNVHIHGEAFYEVGIEYTAEPTNLDNRCLMIGAINNNVTFDVKALFTKCVDYYYNAD